MIIFINFKEVNSKSIKNSVAGVIAHIPIPFPLPGYPFLN